MGETDRSGPDEGASRNNREAEERTPAGAAPDAPEDQAEQGAAGPRDGAEGGPTQEPRESVAGRDGTQALQQHGALSEAEELRGRLEAREHHLRELYDEVARSRLAADEARARREAVEARSREVAGERDRLAQRVREYEEEERRRGRRREGQERHVARLGREVERRDAEIRRLEDLLATSRDEMEARSGEEGALAARKEEALQEALRRIAMLERDLEEMQAAADAERAAAEKLRAELDLEQDLRQRMAEPTNRLRAGIDLFNESEVLRSVHSISKSMGQPEVHVEIDGRGDESPAVLTFTWQGITWQTYHANPGLAVEEPRVYLVASGEDLSGVERKPLNARLGPGGKVVLGL